MAQEAVEWKITGYVNKVKLSDIDAVYIQVEIPSGFQFFSGSAIKTYKVNYGQTNQSSQAVRDSSGNKIIFNSTASSMNFFYYNGWEYVETQIAGLPNQIIIFRNKRYFQ